MNMKPPEFPRIQQIPHLGYRAFAFNGAASAPRLGLHCMHGSGFSSWQSAVSRDEADAGAAMIQSAETRLGDVNAAANIAASFVCR